MIILVGIIDGSQLNQDLQHFVSLREYWELLLENGMEAFDFSITVDTEIDKNMSIAGNGILEWPHVVHPSSSVLHFPLTLIGNSSVSLFIPS